MIPAKSITDCRAWNSTNLLLRSMTRNTTPPTKANNVITSYSIHYTKLYEGGLKDLQAEESAVSDETMIYTPQMLEDSPLKSVLEQDKDSDELDERRKQQLERERERQEELDRRIRTRNNFV